MAEIRVIEDKEIWWATTNEYTLEIDGETVICRIAETPKETTFFEFTDSGGWEEASTNGGIMEIIKETWEAGELS
ncbi:MAG: hypothetical protein ACKVK6_15370 [bacterium]|jgi:hypothetical protein|tara:strand:- start:1040 stop:1264 length:225 start_codon:yes stop_codon:yes gene_type:complete